MNQSDDPKSAVSRINTDFWLINIFFALTRIAIMVFFYSGWFNDYQKMNVVLTKINQTKKVLIDVIMQVTINLEPFNGTISLDHYGFDPCEYRTLYWDQLRGDYKDEVYYHRQLYLTTCVSNSSQFALESWCHNIDTSVSRLFSKRYSQYE